MGLLITTYANLVNVWKTSGEAGKQSKKELENEISHYRRISKKYMRAKTIINAFATSTGVLTVVLSSAGLTTSWTGIGIIAGAPLAGIAGLMGIASTAAGVSSGRLNIKKVTKHEKTISLAESKHLSVSRLVSKALTDGEVSDVEFNLILREIENYYSLKGQLRREVRIENKSSDKNVDVEAIKKEIKNEYQKKTRFPNKHKRLRIEFEKRESGFSLFILRERFTS